MKNIITYHMFEIVPDHPGYKRIFLFDRSGQRHMLEVQIAEIYPHKRDLMIQRRMFRKDLPLGSLETTPLSKAYFPPSSNPIDKYPVSFFGLLIQNPFELGHHVAAFLEQHITVLADQLGSTAHEKIAYTSDFTNNLKGTSKNCHALCPLV